MDYNKILESEIRTEKMLLKSLDSETGIWVKIMELLSNNLIKQARSKLVLNYPVDEIKTTLNLALLLYYHNQKNNITQWLTIQSCSLLAMSDNPLLIDFFKSYQLDLYKDEKGVTAMLIAFKQIVINDIEGLKQTYIYLKNLKGDYDPLFLEEAYFPLYQGFIEKDSNSIAFGIEAMLKNDFISKMVTIFPEERTFSILAMAYIKLAFRKGLNPLEYDGKFTESYSTLSADWAKYKPLEVMTMPYKFLIEFCKEENLEYAYSLKKI